MPIKSPVTGEDGFTVKEIADEYGCTYEQLVYYLGKKNFLDKYNKFTMGAINQRYVECFSNGQKYITQYGRCKLLLIDKMSYYDTLYHKDIVSRVNVETKKELRRYLDLSSYCNKIQSELKQCTQKYNITLDELRNAKMYIKQLEEGIMNKVSAPQNMPSIKTCIWNFDNDYLTITDRADNIIRIPLTGPSDLWLVGINSYGNITWTTEEMCYAVDTLTDKFSFTKYELQLLCKALAQYVNDNYKVDFYDNENLQINNIGIILTIFAQTIFELPKQQINFILIDTP
ncbi:hypothetical protein AN641_07915 [Candidatus Epulonipiscioides gigas]|nr:hypothetical protein AN641_07915 [Epulopiscium sp. SCG-C07WGA-EpuloA2]